MQRFRAQDGFLGYIGLFAALVIVAILMSTSLKLFSGAGSGGPSGAPDDGAAQTIVQHAFSALQRCAQKQGGNFQGCNVDQIIENEPTLIPYRNHITAVVSGGSAKVSAAASSGNTFTIAIDRGVTIRPCTKPGQGSCPASGRW